MSTRLIQNYLGVQQLGFARCEISDLGKQRAGIHHVVRSDWKWISAPFEEIPTSTR
ncbi:MAG: hypothetical protein WBM41_18225 [Arenicellales bacterium]